ncbi:MAG: hypothetical protein IJB79_09075 [Candidatus Gastranaerophilales bacterium]|nr:hypothetical protein [Candidatus Gastranaerophilales bacterium]
MRFFKTIYKNEIVFVINEKIVDDSLAHEIISEISSNKRAGLDMSKVQNINSPILIEYLLNNKIKLFNLQSELIAYFALILKDGFLKTYMNFSDFKDNKRELIKRRFLIA